MATLRSALNSGTKNAPLITTLAAFSPDIIPLDKVKATPAELVSSYNDFIAHTIDLNEPTTSVYIRGKQETADPTLGTKAILRAVPNELILWPQVWATANIIGHTELQLDSDTGHKQIVVGGTPIQYSPIPIPPEGHSHVTLIATVTAPIVASSSSILGSIIRGGMARVLGSTSETALPPVKNWRDLVEHVGKNTSLAFYNVQTADPTSRRAKLTTKFRLIENEEPYVELFFGIEAMGIPTSGVDASLNVVGKGPNNTAFSCAINRQPLSRAGVYGKGVLVPSGFEGHVTLEVFNYDKQVFGDYSSISIVVYAVGSAGDVLLGAEHLLFDSNPRVKSLARRYNVNLSASQGAQSNLAPAPFFYFRESTSDAGNFPRSENASHSPDIQPLGTVQDQNPAATLSNFSVDVADQRQTTLVSDTSNFVYLRGNTVVPNTGQTRLFYVPASIILHPSLYSQPSHVVFDVDDNGNPVVAYRQYSSLLPQPIVITTPFTLDNIPPPANGDHYCLIAEALPPSETQWPHEIVSNFATSAEFAAWVLSEPCVAWRNIAYTTNPHPDTQTLQTSFTIPPGYSPTDKFQFQVQATDCPNGSSFSVTSDDPSIMFPEIPITTNPTIATSAFTGKSPGFSSQVTIHWFANGQTALTGQNLSIVLIQIVPAASNLGLVAAASAEATTTKVASYHVDKSYPNLVTPDENNGGRVKIGGAIRARSLGEVNDESSDSVIPILKGIIVGADRISF